MAPRMGYFLLSIAQRIFVRKPPLFPLLQKGDTLPGRRLTI